MIAFWVRAARGLCLGQRRQPHRECPRCRLMLDSLEARCLLSCNLTMPMQFLTAPELSPIDEMVGGPNGDLWFTRDNSIVVNHLHPDGTIDQFPVPPSFGQPSGLELDPAYVDTAIRRWQALTGGEARHAVSGRRFDDLTCEAEAANAI